MAKPRIAITMGEPAGIGPEILVKVAEDAKSFCNPLIIGSASLLYAVAEKLKKRLNFSLIKETQIEKYEGSIIDLGDLDDITPGKPTKESAKAALSFIDKAIELAAQKKVDAIVTCPVCKHTIWELGIRFVGHTEYIAQKMNIKDFLMVFMTEKFSVALVTTHVALSLVSSLITEERVFNTIKMVYEALKKFYGKEPKIAISGLNPHAGEEGLFGTEEERIKEALAEAEKEGIKVEGPFAPDTAFYIAQKEGFDAIICMYHDQGLIPVKLLSFEEAVNVTLGLPFVRTSPAHGVAFDIAGRWIASPKSLFNAIKCAASLV